MFMSRPPPPLHSDRSWRRLSPKGAQPRTTMVPVVSAFSHIGIWTPQYHLVLPTWAYSFSRYG